MIKVRQNSGAYPVDPATKTGTRGRSFLGRPDRVGMPPLRYPKVVVSRLNLLPRPKSQRSDLPLGCDTRGDIWRSTQRCHKDMFVSVSNSRQRSLANPTYPPSSISDNYDRQAIQCCAFGAAASFVQFNLLCYPLGRIRNVFAHGQLFPSLVGG